MSWLNNIKLSISQWISITALAVIGTLVVALRLQGGKLHATQIALLESQLNNTMDKDDAEVVAAKAAMLRQEKALYEENK